ncbi:SRPBCC family protein [Pedobacter immunditicola]|uniref:SRPBCC family protein n=1 Tax=Pedobacter immunditicola TaxID=3133440 RepID=UPI0030A09AD7
MKTRTASRHTIIAAPADKVFDYMDQLDKTGMHMMKSSTMMMGSKLALVQVSENSSGLNSSYRWHGSVMGWNTDFTVRVTKWIRYKEKVWETIGEAKMIIMSWYRMKLLVMRQNQASEVELSIDYKLPRSGFYRVLGYIFAPIYSHWCLKNMLNDSKKQLERGIC